MHKHKSHLEWLVPYPELSHSRSVLNVHKRTHIAKLEFRNIY